MKFSLLFMLLFLFSTNCGLFKRKTTGKSKIQKSNEYQLVCEQPFQVPSYEAKCSSGQPVCGKQSDDDYPRVYCIDKDDTILNEDPSCCTYDDSCIESFPDCKKTVVQQMGSDFTPVCEGEIGFSFSRVKCGPNSVQEGDPVCGTTLKNTDLIAYCMDSDSTVVGRACCKYAGDTCSQPARCVQLSVIQKNSAFAPECEGSGHEVKCPSQRLLEGSPACGTESGSGDLLAYCINENDQILGRAQCCDTYPIDESTCRYLSHCTQLIQGTR